MNKRSLCKRLLAVVCLLAVLVSTTACGSSSMVKVFDRTVEMIERRNADKNSVEGHDIFEQLEKMGLTELDEECLLDREFVKSYLKTCSVENFFQKIQTINAFMMDYGVWTSECKTVDATETTCTRIKCNALLRLVLEEGGVEVAGLKLPAEGTSGYYSEHADMYPAYFEKMVERGYNYGPYNEIAYDYKPHYLETTYYGDYALFHSYGYKVIAGKLGWYNGVFVDEQESWAYEDIYYVGYRGMYITDDYESAEAAIAAVENMEAFTIDNVTYRFTEQMPCGDSDHTYQSWRVFFDAEAAAEEAQEEADRNAQLDGQYNEALALMESGKYTEAIAAFEALYDHKDSPEKVLACKYAYGLSLREAGKFGEAYLQFMEISGYSDAWIQCMDIVQQLNRKTLAAGSVHSVALKTDGTVVAVGVNNDGRCNVSGWTDIVEVAAGDYHTVGLKTDGTVVATGYNKDGQCDVSDWTDIVAVAAGASHTVGLKADGSVVVAGSNYSGQANAARWTGIIAIAAGDNHTVGLTREGRVVAEGNNKDDQCDVDGWVNVISLAAGGNHTVGLRADGRMFATGDNYGGRCDVSGWRDIVAISANYYQTVGVKADGTVVAVGDSEFGCCNVSGWNDVVAVAAGLRSTIGLKADGTVVATEFVGAAGNYGGEGDVSGWTDIKLP